MFTRSDSYRVLARFQAAHGAATSLALSHDGGYLASGGDNESVHVWGIDEGKTIAVLSDRLGRWGQITCMKWVEGVAQPRGYTLCFGTGRGFVLFYEKVKDSDTFREHTCRAIFPFNDPVEAIDYNSQKERLVVSSHAGKIAMYSVGKQGAFLETIWVKRLSELANGKGTIPRAVHFAGAGESVIICSLETGIIFSKASNNGNDSWNQQIKSSIGHARLSPNGNMILVDNLIDGFDIYTFPSLEHFDFLEIPRSEAYIHGGTFAEGSDVVACGSDHGRVYLFSTATNKCIEKLRIGTKTSTIQAVDAFSNDKHHLIAGATNDNTAEIIIWRKPRVKAARSHGYSSGGSVSVKVMISLNVMILAVALALFFPSWFCQEMSYDKMERLRRQSEDVEAWELAKARAVHEIHEAQIMSTWRKGMTHGDDKTEHLKDNQKNAIGSMGTDIRVQQARHMAHSNSGPDQQTGDNRRGSDWGETRVRKSADGLEQRMVKETHESEPIRNRWEVRELEDSDGDDTDYSKAHRSRGILEQERGEKVRADKFEEQQVVLAELTAREG